uniref:Uncharacterized protein n=1 Tax=Arundo donax TaxID=35708 RepID=A0A0A8YXT5_ARUDO
MLRRSSAVHTHATCLLLPKCICMLSTDQWIDLSKKTTSNQEAVLRN